MNRFKEGDRFQSKYANVTGTLIKIRSSGKKPYTIQWDDGRKVHCDESWLNSMKFLEDNSTTKEAIAECNLNTPVSLQESPDLNLELRQPEQLTSSLQDYSSRITPTLKQFSSCNIPTSQSTATSATITLNRESSTFTQLDFLVLEQAAQETVQDLNTQNHPNGLKPCAASPIAAPASSSLKILKDLSIEDYEQFLGDSEWLVIVGTIRSSYRRRKLDHPNNVTDSSLLPTPTTYAKGSTGCRPAGQTRLEQKLKPYLTKGDKLSPAVPGWMMGFPVGWVEKTLMDGGETISVQLPFTPEYVTTQTNAESVTTSTPVQFAPSRQRSQLSESVTSPISPTSPKQVSSLLPTPHFLTRANAKAGTYVVDQLQSLGIIKQNLGFEFVVDWLNPPSGKDVTYNWERDGELIKKLAIALLPLVTKFLEENERSSFSVQQAKPSKQKGCLYKYLENKKLKDGTIATYPRVIGHRQPDNPTHWRWGFNWEEKIDGEWKGRSIGSVPVGAVPMIQSMQKEGASLEEIIAFIRRAKAKK
nr:hypothetical protein [Nostoc sp. FACHB-190]